MNAFRWLLPAALGPTTVTAFAVHRLEWPDVYVALRRHATPRRRTSHPSARHPALHGPLDGCRQLSTHRDRRGQRFWIITEADHSGTTVLLPEEYSATQRGMSLLHRMG